MIYSNINCKSRSLDEKILKCLKYAKENNLFKFEKGKHIIDGENIFVNIVEYETCEKEERFWEAHRDYIDIHIMLKGKEIIGVNFINNLEQGEYKKEKDFLALKGDIQNNIILEENDYVICYPEDAHMTAIKVDEKETIKKAIFKVIIK